ncbi:MAG: Malonyl CoA-acyl carrier protein transacylase [Legionellaceae bacterium]
MLKKIAFVFPGQGSQSLGMLSELSSQFPVVNTVFEEASTVVGYDLWKLTQEGPVDTLNKTEYTQPALLTASIALWRIWEMEQGVEPILLAGHSLGEYSALVCAKAITFSSAVKLVAARGRYMQAAVSEGEGAMAAIIGLSDEQVNEICLAAAQNEIVTSANFNAPGQVVIAGNVGAIERAIELAKKAGSKLAKKIPVSVSSHCELMRPAAEYLAKDLNEITLMSPQIPIIHNIDVLTHPDEESIKKALIAQLYSSVRWVEIIEKMENSGIDTIVECGPGKVLAGLNKRITHNAPTLPIYDSSTVIKALEECR